MKKIRIISGTLFLLFGLSVAANAQKIQAKAVLDSTQILIGDQVKLRIELDQPSNVNIVFPVIGDSLSSTVEVIDRSPLDTFKLDDKEQIKIIQNLTITSFDSGPQQVPPFYFELKYNELSDTIQTLPVEFFVHSMPIDTTKGPTDIKRPYGAPVTLAEVSPYILGIILIGAIVFFIFYYLRRKKNNKPVFGKPAKPKEPAHVIALRRLDKVKEEKLWQTGEIKLFYSEVSDTLRSYIEERFQIRAMEYTTDETIKAFNEQKELLTDKSFAELKNILSLSDLVKFAKYSPTPDDHNLCLMNAYFFVEHTKIEEVKEPSKEDLEEYYGDEKTDEQSSGILNFLGNIAWLVFGGFFVFVFYVIYGTIFCISIIGIPFGMQAFKLAMYALWPFNKTIVEKKSSNGCLSVFMNIAWIPEGISIATIHFIFGLLMFITIIGIPFGKQHLKMARLALTPFGMKVINK